MKDKLMQVFVLSGVGYGAGDVSRMVGIRRPAGVKKPTPALCLSSGTAEEPSGKNTVYCSS